MCPSRVCPLVVGVLAVELRIVCLVILQLYVYPPRSPLVSWSVCLPLCWSVYWMCVQCRYVHSPVKVARSQSTRAVRRTLVLDPCFSNIVWPTRVMSVLDGLMWCRLLYHSANTKKNKIERVLRTPIAAGPPAAWFWRFASIFKVTYDRSRD